MSYRQTMREDGSISKNRNKRRKVKGSITHGKYNIQCKGVNEFTPKRLRCILSGKICYNTKKKAVIAGNRIADSKEFDDGKKGFTIYRCEYCAKFHLTTQVGEERHRHKVEAKKKELGKNKDEQSVEVPT